MKEAPQFYSSYGSFVHKLIEGYYKGEIPADKLKERFLIGFKEEVQGERPQASTVKKYIEAGKQYFGSFKPFPYKPIGIEKLMAFTVDGHPFVGYIDYLGESKDGLVVIDNKSRDLKPRSKRANPTVKDLELDDMLRQLYLYAGAVKEEYGEFPKSLCFNCFKSGTFIEEPFIEDKYNEAMAWAKDSIDDICNVNEFPPMMDYFKCKYICGVSDQCCYYNGR